MAATSIRNQILNEAYAFIDKRVSELFGDVLSEAAIAAYSKSLKAGLHPDLDARIVDQLSSQPAILAATIDKAKAEFEVQVDKTRADFEKSTVGIQAQLEKLRTFIDTPLPLGWRDYPIESRREFWASDHSAGIVERNKICGLEVWMELFNKSRATYNGHEARRINKLLAACCPGWELRSCIKFGDLYGYQRGFINTLPKGDRE